MNEFRQCTYCWGVIDPQRIRNGEARNYPARYCSDRCRILAACARYQRRRRLAAGSHARTVTLPLLTKREPQR